MDRYGVATYYRALVHLEQHPYESTYDYLERTKYYANKIPYHVLPLHEIINHFLDGMLPKERYMMDIMAGGSIMDRTPMEVWRLMEERAERTRPYTNYNTEQTLEEMIWEINKQAVQPEASERTKLLAKIGKRLLEIERKLGEKAEEVHELESAPVPTQVSLDDEKVTVSIEERADEDVMDEELQVVLITSTEDVPAEERISPQCSDIIIEQNTVIACNPIILPVSNLVLSSHVQNGEIKEALHNNQVWGLLKTVRIHIPIIRNPMRMQTSEQFLDIVCINWKTRKKDMQGSLEKMNTHSHMAWARKQTQRLVKLPKGLHRTWKRRKNGKYAFVDEKCSMLSVYMQKSRSTYGWKPGWNSWRSISHKVTRKVRRGVRKFDGVHPWAPNIC